MTDSFDNATVDYSKPVPAARALTNFTATEVGDDEIVLFDHVRMTYHTLNRSAFAVWQLCDGDRTFQRISARLNESAMPLPAAGIELAIAELDEAGLLSGTTPFDARVNRRSLLKLAAAGAVGAALIPAVSSITAPVSAETATQCGAFLGFECENNNDCKTNIIGIACGGSNGKCRADPFPNVSGGCCVCN